MSNQSLYVLRVELARHDRERSCDSIEAGPGWSEKGHPGTSEVRNTSGEREEFVLRTTAFGLSQQMTHFHFFGLKIAGVVRVGFTPNRHLLDHFDAVAFQADNLLRIIREKAKFPHAEIE